VFLKSVKDLTRVLLYAKIADSQNYKAVGLLRGTGPRAERISARIKTNAGIPNGLSLNEWTLPVLRKQGKKESFALFIFKI
jgi:hypothetical protein